MNAHLVKSTRYIGTTLAIAAAIWFVVVLYREDSFAAALWHEQQTWKTLAVCMFAYSGLGIFLACAWVSIVPISESANRLFVFKLVTLSALTQIYKYLPTNTLHLIGRHAEFIRNGFNNRILLTSLILEQVLLGVGAILVIVAFFALDHQSVGLLIPDAIYKQRNLLLTVGITLCVLIIVGYLRLSRSETYISNLISNRATSISVSLILYVIFFVLSGFLLLKLATPLNLNALEIQNSAVIASFSVAWLVGNYTPGSPAGAGVREAVLIVLLERLAYSENNAFIVLFFRLVTLGGDCILAMVAFLVLRKLKKFEQPASDNNENIL